MMSKEKAVEIVVGRCMSVARKIERNESRRKMPDWYSRRWFGAFRRLLVEAGCDQNLIPDEPYLDPSYDANYKQWVAEKKALESSNVTIVED